MHNSRLYEIKVSSNLEDSFQDANKEMCHLQLVCPFLNNPTRIEIMRERT